MFHEFGDALGFPDVDAQLEQAVMLGAIYWNARARAEAVIGHLGGGALLGWEFQNVTWPASFALFRQGNNLFVSITGTHNFPQLYGDIIGAFAGEYAGFVCRVHRFFLNSWLDLRVRILASAPADWRTCDWHFVGHSLGGAIAFLGATEFQRDLPGQRISYMGFAAAKSLTAGYTGRLPFYATNIANTDDVVPLLPVNRTLNGIIESPALWALGLPNDWKHYGFGVTMDPFGRITTVNSSYFAAVPTPRNIGATIGSHPIGSYMQRTEQRWLAANPPPIDDFLLTQSDTIRRLPVVQDGNVNVNANNAVDIAFQNRVIFAHPIGGPLNRVNLPLLNNIAARIAGVERENPLSTRADAFGGGSMACKITFFFRENSKDVSETWYDQTRGPSELTIPLLQSYIDARTKISGNQTAFVYCRVSTVGTARAVKIYYPHDFPRNMNIFGWNRMPAVDQASDYIATALLIRKTSGLKFSRFWLRGVPDGVVTVGGEYTPNVAYRNDVESFTANVIALGWGWRGVSGNVNPPALITAATQNADVTVSFTLGGNLFQGVAVGAKVVARITGQQSPRNINGTYTVLVNSANTCTTIKQVPLVNFHAGNGKMVYSSLGYNAITSMQVERVSGKKAGRPFDQSAGHSRRRVLV